MHSYLKLIRAQFKALPGQAKHIIAIVSVFGFLGLVGLQAGQAATNTTGYEAESGATTGAATVDAAAGASGDKVVTFGNSQAPPTNVQAVTGGNNIVILWDLPTGNIKHTEVYRNGNKIATVIPNTGAIESDLLGTRYVDKAVSRGSTYQYRLKVVNTAGVASDFSAMESATHPTSTTPIPNVVIDAPSAPDLVSFLNDYVKPEIETWYPKISDYLAYPDYTPISSLRLWADPNYKGSTYVGGGLPAGTVAFNAAWIRERKPDAPGIFMHEMAHAVQSYPDYPFWQIEGMADWVRDWMIREGRYKHNTLDPDDKYTDGYSASAQIFQWMETRYGSGNIRKLNIALHNGTYTDAMFKSLTGKTAEKLFDEVRSQHYFPIGILKNSAGKCVEIASGNTADGAKMQLAACNGSNQQRWRQIYKDVGVSAGLNGATKAIFYIMNPSVAAPNGKCVDVKQSGTAAGTIVHSYGCSYDYVNLAQMWKLGANGSLVNPNSGKCLDTSGGSTTDGAQLVISVCNGSASQTWTIP